MPDILSIGVTANGFESLEKEAKEAAEKSILAATGRRISARVVSEMKEVLARHVEDDVYDGGYYPRMYERRSNNPAYGESLKESAYKAKELPSVSDGKLVAGIDYQPTGEHANVEWDTADGNELIGRIERKNPMYTYYPKNGFIPDRPFWQNFVNEMIEGGGFERAVEDALRAEGIEVEASDPVMREPEDGNY